jgi:hypothetical protein
MTIPMAKGDPADGNTMKIMNQKMGRDIVTKNDARKKVHSMDDVTGAGATQMIEIEIESGFRHGRTENRSRPATIMTVTDITIESLPVKDVIQLPPRLLHANLIYQL